MLQVGQFRLIDRLKVADWIALEVQDLDVGELALGEFAEFICF